MTRRRILSDTAHKAKRLKGYMANWSLQWALALPTCRSGPCPRKTIGSIAGMARSYRGTPWAGLILSSFAGSQKYRGFQLKTARSDKVGPLLQMHDRKMLDRTAVGFAGKKKHGAQYWTPRSFQLAEWTGLEPATPGVTGRYSNQLNYHSKPWWVLRGSNPRPSPCKGDALPAELSTQSSGLRFLRKISIPAMA